MALRVALSLCAALTAAGGTARADGAFAIFKSICIDTQASDTDALEAADKAGWMPMPETMLDKFPLRSYQGKPQGRIRSTPDGINMLVTADSIFSNLSNTHGKMCTMAFPGGTSDFAGQADDFAAVPKHQTNDSEYFYLWREENGIHVAIGDEDAKSASKLPGAVHFLGAGQGQKMSFLVFGIASPQN